MYTRFQLYFGSVHRRKSSRARPEEPAAGLEAAVLAMSTTNVAAAPTTAPFASKVTDKSAISVKYSSDIPASWTSEDQIKNTKGKGSVAGSLYYTASDNDSQSETGSVYDAVSLSDSDKDFQIEVASTGMLAPLALNFLAICCIY